MPTILWVFCATVTGFVSGILFLMVVNDDSRQHRFRAVALILALLMMVFLLQLPIWK